MTARHTTVFLFHWPAALLIGLLVCLLSLPAIIGFGWDDAISLQKLENRKMTRCPPFALFQEKPARYIEELEQFLKDRVGFRRLANEVYRRMRYYILHDPPLANITIGRDGFVFMNSHRVDQPNFIFDLLCEQQTNPSKELVGKMDRLFSRISSYYRGRGYEVTLLAAPTNVALYPDKLPFQVDKRYRESCQAYATSDNLLFQLRRMGQAGNRYRLYYPLELFAAHRDEPYFYPKEKWHWTGRSAFLFTRDLLVESGVMPAAKLDDPWQVQTVGDDLGMFFGFSRNVKALSYAYADFKTTKEKPAWQKSFSERGGMWRFATDNALSEKRGLLLSNSFGIELAPHLAMGFKEFFFYNLNHLQKREERQFFARIVELTRPDHIYILFDDAGIIAALDRLGVFLEMEEGSADPVHSSKGEGLSKSGQ